MQSHTGRAGAPILGLPNTPAPSQPGQMTLVVKRRRIQSRSPWCETPPDRVPCYHLAKVDRC